MKVKIVDLHFDKIVFLLFFRLCLWEINDSGLEPASIGMKGIDSIIDFKLFSSLPLLEDSARVDTNILIIFAGPSRVMNIQFSPLDIDYFPVDPFVLWVQHVYILSDVKLQIGVIWFHIKN
jgi:hypothetical protein